MQNSKKNYTMLLLLILSIALISSGCQRTADFFRYEKNAVIKQEVVKEGILSIDRIKTLNPIVSKDRDVYFLNKLLYHSLFVLNDNLIAQPDLAESYEYDDKKNTLKIKIKKGIKWSNGNELTVDDIKFSMDAYKKASFNGLSIYSKQLENISMVTVDSDYIILKYFSPFKVSLEDLTFPIVHKNSFKDINSAIQVKYNYLPITSGQYKVTSFNPYSELILEGNEFYSQNVPENKLIFKIIPKSNENMNLIEPNLLTIGFSEKLSRDVDFANLTANEGAYLSNEIEWIGFNVNRPNMNNKNIRLAIAKSIDVSLIIESCYFGKGVLTDSLYYPDYLGVLNEGDLYEQNYEEARVLLNKSGFSDVGNSGKMKDASGNGLSINILVNSNDESRNLAAKQIKSDLMKAGMESNIITIPWDEYLNAISIGNYDIYIGGANMPENYDLRPILKSYSGNPINYVNPDVDILLDKLQSFQKNSEKIKIYREIKSILSTELPYYPMLFKTFGVITSKDFQGTVEPVFFDIYKHADTWSFNKNVEEEKEDMETNE